MRPHYPRQDPKVILLRSARLVMDRLMITSTGLCLLTIWLCALPG